VGQLRREQDGPVQEARLLDGPDRLGVAQSGDADDPDLVVVVEQLECPLHDALTISEVGTDAYIGPRHADCYLRHLASSRGRPHNRRCGDGLLGSRSVG